MGFIDDELSQVKRVALPNCRLISCVQTMVRAEIRITDFKVITACIQFPDEYPSKPLLLELKSKTLSETLLQRLTEACEQDNKKNATKAQVLPVLKFLHRFILENPLSCCYDEITQLREKLNSQSQEDELRLKQKTSSIILRAFNKKYYFRCRVVVPNDYPKSAVRITETETNFPQAIYRHVAAQSSEIARQCVEPPLRKKNAKPVQFQPKPSLQRSLQYVIDCIKSLPGEKCQFCRKDCFPDDPALVETDESSASHIERVYCGHLFHQGCLFDFMKLPPFGNKKCGACGVRINHYKWSLSDKLAEDRWAHQQARERELEEVEDFFK